VGYNGFCGDDEDEKTDPGIGPTSGQSVMSGGCHAGNQVNPKSVYAEPSKKDNAAEANKGQPRTYSYSWTPGSGVGTNKDGEIPPPRDTVPIRNTSTQDAATTNYNSGGTRDYYGGSRYGGSTNYAPYKDNFHNGSGMGYKPPPPPEEPNEIFIYDSTPGSVIRKIMERDGFLRLARTEPKWKFLDIGRGEFPAMAERGKVAVIGEVYKAVPRTMKMLDSMLDAPSTFRREVISLEDGKKVYAYIMPTYKTPFNEVSVDSGNWALWKKGERSRNRAFREAEVVRRKKEEQEAIARRAREADERAKWADRCSSSNQDDKNPKKRRVHISAITAMELRVMLHANNINTDAMDDKAVRVECIQKYGSWYLVDV
jgi:gamma-glutamylcyclotransferase (GGCT)/AIG2-like uncharacterized protein YtfP